MEMERRILLLNKKNFCTVKCIHKHNFQIQSLKMEA